MTREPDPGRAPSDKPSWSRREFLRATAGLCAATACARRDDRVLHFWAMGREGEVATQLLRAFERENSGLRVRVEQLPWSAAHEKLLTAFAGDATPDLAQMGNTWLPEFVAVDALEPLDPSVRGSAQVDLADYDSGIVDTNLVDGKQYGVPWYVDTRVLFYRRDLLAQAGYAAPPRDWDEWMRMLGAVKQRVGPERYALLLPLNEYEPMVALWLQQGEPLLRDGGRRGNFRSPGFARTLQFYLAMYERRLAPPITHNADRQRLERVRPRLLQLLHLRALADRRVQEAAASRAPVGLDDGAPPWPHGPRRIHRRRVEPGDLPAFPAQGRGLEAGGIPLAP